VSFGGLTVGLFSIGGIVFGLLSMGAFSFGLLSFGGMAVGLWSLGGFALAWNGAEGGLAIARHFAVGGFAHAAQANTEVAQHYLNTSQIFQLAHFVNHHFIFTTLLWVVPMFVQWRVLARKKRARQS
jgi:hypothetical protein